MEMKDASLRASISPIPARSIADLELDEKVYKPDFEITAKYQAFSKELSRIALLGLGVYGFLIKMATDQPGVAREYFVAIQEHRYLAVLGVAAFAASAACALMHGFLATKCLGHQLIISRYFGRLEGSRWPEPDKTLFRQVIHYQQKAQHKVLRWGTSLLFIATISLIIGAVLVGICSSLILFNR
jgi:hypothetical protein